MTLLLIFLLLVLIKLTFFNKTIFNKTIIFLWYEIWTCHRMEMLLIQCRFTHLMKRHLVMCVGVQACVCVCVCMFWDKFILDICIDRLDSRSPSPTLPYCSLHCWCCLRNLELVKIYVLKTDLLTLRTEIIKIHDSGSVCTSWLLHNDTLFFKMMWVSCIPIGATPQSLPWWTLYMKSGSWNLKHNLCQSLEIRTIVWTMILCTISGTCQII